MAVSRDSENAAALPRPMTRFIGRQDEIESILALLRREDVRLVTLTGPGGIGKTRLAIELANRMALDPAWTVRFVSLATVTTVDEAIVGIAASLGLWNSHQSDAIVRLSTLLEQEPVLLVIDNLEHVIDIAGDLAALLGATTQLKLLATSRSPLHVRGEREYSVPQLTIPHFSDATERATLLQSESVELFIDRAESINHSFDVDEHNAQAIAAICKRLDGLPLAIELAAARTRALPPIALLSRLDNQLEMLRSEARDVPPRLRTIRATIDWSYRLLTSEEQQALRSLSIFSGDFSLSAATAMLMRDELETLNTLESLIDKSLLLTREPFQEEPHFRILSVVRQFGLEQMETAGELDNVRERQAAWAGEFCESLFDAQLAAEQHDVFQRIGRVHETITHSITWAIANQRWELAARIGANLWQYWDISGYLHQGRGWLRALIEQDIDWPDELVPKLYYGFAILAGNVDDAHENERVAEILLQRYADSTDIRIKATALNMIGLCRKPEIALEASQAAARLWQEAGEPVWHGLAAGLAGRWARELGDLDLSESCSQQSFDVLSAAGHLWGKSLALQGIGRVHHLRGDISEAEKIYRQGLAELEPLGDRILVLRYFEFLIEIAAHHGQWERAIQLSGAATRMRELMSYDLRFNAEAEASRRLHAEARRQLGDDQFESAWHVGRKRSLEASIRVALLERPPASESAPPRSDGLLTRRELDVLRLIVAGKTDQTIADELFVSYRTVTTHVTNILNKLGVNSRTEAAAIAVRTHLIGDEQ